MGIAVAIYALRNVFNDPAIGVPGIIDFLHKQDIDLVELNALYTQPDKFTEFAATFVDAGIRPIQVTVDGNNFFAKTESERKAQFAYMKQWIDPAHEVGIPIVRANMGHRTTLFRRNDTLPNLLETFRPILDYTESLDMNFVFENHGGRSSDVNFQLQVKKALPSPHFGYLLDFGNYKPKSLVYDNIKKLGSSILAVHAKAYFFDADGNETTLDVGRIIQNLREVGYQGDYNVEFEGQPRLPDFEGTEKTIQLLRKYL